MKIEGGRGGGGRGNERKATIKRGYGEIYPSLLLRIKRAGGGEGNSFQVLVAGRCDGIRFRFPSTVK